MPADSAAITEGQNHSTSPTADTQTFLKSLRPALKAKHRGPVRDIKSYRMLTRKDAHTVLPMVTPWDRNVCDGVSQPRVTSFNAAALFSPPLMSGCDS